MHPMQRFRVYGPHVNLQFLIWHAKLRKQMQTGQSPWKLRRSRPLWGIWGCKAQQGSRGNKHYRSRSCTPVLGERHVMIMDIYHLNISVIKKIRYWSHKMMNEKEMLSTNRDDNGDATGDGAPDGAKEQQDYLVCKRFTYCLGKCVNFSPSLRNL